MDIKELVYKNRSYRRFDENYIIDIKVLEQLTDLARMSPNGGNLQSLRYILSADKNMNGTIFKTLRWAAYFKDWEGPAAGERPTGYVIMLNKNADSANAWTEAGIAAQSIMLGATELGLGGCIFRNIDKTAMKDALGISDDYEIYMTLAIGKAVEEVCVDALENGGSVKYWRDEKGIHHVPKRHLSDIVLSKY